MDKSEVQAAGADSPSLVVGCLVFEVCFAGLASPAAILV